MAVRIAIAFDYDDTLGPDSTTGYLREHGVDTASFWAERVSLRIADGWDPTLAYMWEMVKESRERPAAERFTRQSMADYGRRHGLYEGATRFFSALRRWAASQSPAAQLEFYVISSGLAPIVEATRVRKQLADVWACEFEYDDAGAITFPKRVVSFTDKTRYLFQIEKGIGGQASRGKPLLVNRKVLPQDYHVPMSQMIYVGDGMTDVPCFSLLQKHGGYAIAVFHPVEAKKWREAWGYVADSRVSSLVPTGLSTNGNLYLTLRVLITGILAEVQAHSKSALA